MNKKIKRILVMVNDVRGGGAEKVADTQIRLLQQYGQYEIAAATCGEKPPNLADNRYYPMRNFLETPLTRLSGTLGLGLNRCRMRKCLNKFQPDIIHMHAFVQFAPGALAEIMSYKQKTSCRIILTHHTFSFICPNDALFNYRTKTVCEKCVGGKKNYILCNICYGNIIGSWGKYIQKRHYYHIFQLGLVDEHLAPSHFICKKLHEDNLSLSVQILKNPCLQKIAEGYPSKKQKVVYFGRISREKNLLAAIKAIEMMKNPIQLLLVGDGPESLAIKKAIYKSPAKEYIHFHHGFLEHDKLYPLIADAQFFILPSVWYENSPVSIVEAVNLGMIPLVSGIGGMRELIENLGVGYCFNPNDILSIVNTIELARRCVEHDRNLLQQAPRRKLMEFAEKTYLKRLEKIYEQE